MTALTKLWKAVRYPRFAAVYLYGKYRRTVHGGVEGINVTAADWDNLIILDACRYDLFEAHNIINGELRAVRSQGSMTGEFMTQNFGGQSFPDTVYVSANPNPARQNAAFHKVVPLWDDAWDEQLHTVPPQSVVDAALATAREHPEKRLIVHLLQPHYPWIGPEGRAFHERHGYTSLDQYDNVWIQMRRGEVDPETVWAVYQENLEVTLPHVERLVAGLDGRTVVTSDHGNAFGEWSVYGHPAGIYIEPLLKVPWLVVKSDQRRKITEGSVERTTDEGDVSKRLRELGYLEG